MGSTRIIMNLDPASCSKGKCCAQRLGELADADVDDAVELTVAASETLVIHELVKSDQLEVESILEAALSMRKARLEGVFYTMDYPDEEVDQIDSFSDFDDCVMLEAFQDVGLSCSMQEGDHVCQNVFEGGYCPQSEKRNNYAENEHNSADNLIQDDNGKFFASRMTSETRGVKDPALSEASEEISQFTPPKKENTDLLQELMPRDGKGVIFKPVVQETSFLSESEDIAVDECSLVEKHEASSRLASQSSVNYDRFCEGGNEVISSLRDEGSCDLSPIDQLCSIVPCSVPPENGVPFLAPDQNMIGISEGCFGCLASDNTEHLHRFPDLEIQVFEWDGQAVPSFVTGYAQPSIQRKSDRMKNYIKPALKGSAVMRAENENLPSLLPMQPTLAHPTETEENENQKNHKDSTELLVGKENLDACHSHKSLQKVQSECEGLCDTQVRAKKRVRFLESEIKQHQEVSPKGQDLGFTAAGSKRTKYSGARNLEKYSRRKYRKKFVFQDMEFLLTGFSKCKQKKIEQLLLKSGGTVLRDIPSPSVSRQKRHSKASFQLLPIILCPKKLQTTKFLYGCAVKTLILKPKWVTDSISAGSILPLETYMVLPDQSRIRCTKSGKPLCCGDSKRVFDGVGFMLCGKRRFCTQLTIIIKHGGGHIFRSLHSLTQSKEAEKIRLGTIVSEDENRVSRHLRQCALEREISLMPASWILKSLYSGSLLPTTRV